MSNRDFPLPISGKDDGAVLNWPVEQEPTTLIALWPGLAPPTMTEVVGLLGECCDAPPAMMQEMPSRPDVPWAAAFATSLVDAPIILWAEPAKSLPPGELDDPRASTCRWVVGVETMLAQEKAYEEYVNLLTAVAAAIEPVALLDHASGRWLELESLTDLAHVPPGVPPPEALWVIHSVFEKDGGTGSHWLHTHGLRRCGRPELEMLEVPASHAGNAGRLLNDIAKRVLDEDDLPPATKPMSIGPEMDVTLHHWQTLIDDLPEGCHGGAADRAGEGNPHGGVRAVVCGPKPHGLMRKHWRWPGEAVELVVNDRAVIYHSDRETERAATLARARWGELATAFAAVQRAARGHSDFERRAVFVVKAPFAAPEAPDDREHMWMEVHEFRGEAAQGELVNQPLNLSHLKIGDPVEVSRREVSDWQVYTPAGSFGPTDVPALWRVLEVLKHAGPDAQLPRRRRSLHGVPRQVAEGRDDG